jgi:sulfite reductase (ferredoxin)
MPANLAEEIDIFETQMELRRQGKLDEKIFAESRLRRGAYGQRYDNGHRHDGAETRTLDFPSGGLTKGPETLWDAPGMMRIKVPMGRISPEQLETIAELAEEYSDSILHVTTRECIQLHFVKIDDTPDLMRRLAAVGITTREACGNSVRNVTACQFAGVCTTQAFDVTPYAHALTWYLLGHNDTQDFGRKFKIAFSGCKDQPCGLTNIHDLGVIAVTRSEGGAVRRGFEVYVGGGLGAVPQDAKLLDDFVPEDELLPLAQAVCRVFSRLGERKNRARARLKFVVQKLGIEEFKRVVAEERGRIAPDERWSSYLGHLDVTDERPLKPGRPLGTQILPAAFVAWRRTNTQPQPQPGYVVATLRLPLGDLTSDQARSLADIARRYTGDTMRFTAEQNIVMRWVPEADLPALHVELDALGLGQGGASTIHDLTSCPGTDTCKLGISASRGLAAELGRHLAAKPSIDPELEGLHVKMSGCFNSCSQHHIADIGFLGVSRAVGGRRVSHFQLVVGGKWTDNGGAYGMAIGAFPSKNIPRVLDRVTEHYLAAKQPGETMQAFIERNGRAKLKAVLDDLRHVPTYDEDPSFYTDWGDAREYTIGDMGVGECAGEMVTATEFGLAAAEREAFEALLQFEAGNVVRAAELSRRAMQSAARGLIKLQSSDIADDPATVVDEFRTRFHDTGLFNDPFAGAKFASYFFRAHEQPLLDPTREEAHHQIEEAQLFIEAAHACYARLQAKPAA